MSIEEDLCSECGKKGAFIWFICSIVFGSALVYFLYITDVRMVKAKGRYLDSDASRANHLASTSLATDTVDTRQYGRR